MAVPAAQEWPAAAALPAVQPITPETMSAYVGRLKAQLDVTNFEVVDRLHSDGLYVGKRPILGAQGQGQLLNQAGTVFYHTCLYVKTGSKVTGLDFGPAGAADVTANVMEPAPCAPVVHEDAVPDAGQLLLRVDLPLESLDSSTARKAIELVQSRQYHAINNNCIHNTDFLCRVLTKGQLRNAPLAYDALAGKVPEQDHPMLLMFFLMTQLSWFHVCDGSPLTAEFMEARGWQTAAPGAAPPAAALDGARRAAVVEGGRQREQRIDVGALAQALQETQQQQQQQRPQPQS